MVNVIKYIGFVAWAVLTLGSLAAQDERVPEIAISGKPLNISHFLAIGPLSAAHSLLDENQLSGYGLLENELNSEQILGLPPSLLRSVNEAAGSGLIDFHKTFGLESKAGAENIVAYAAVTIISNDSKSAVLLVGSDDEARIWLNGHQIFNTVGQRSLTAWDNAVSVALKEGENFLLIKIGNVDGPWGFSAQLHPTAESAAAALVRAKGRLIDDAIVEAGFPAKLFNPKLFVKANLTASLKPFGGGVARQVHFRAGMAEMHEPPGLYTLVAEMGESVFEQPLYIGSLDTLHKELSAKLQRLETPDRYRIGLAAYLRRVEIVANAEEKNRHINDWDRGILTRNLESKGVFAAMRFMEAYDRIEQRSDPFKDVTGLQIRAFRSSIDESVQHYRLFVPSSYDRARRPLPLIIVQHPIFSVKRPFLEGVVIANQEEAENWSRIAESLGVGILWSGYRVCPYGHPIEFAHLDEVLRAVEADYAVDHTRVTLHGECSSAIGASWAAFRNPERYAGMFLLNPVLHRGGNRSDDQGQFSSFPAFNKWLLTRDPFQPLTRVSTPLSIVHDSNDPAHGPLEHSLAFVAEAEKTGKSIAFKRPKADAGMWLATTIAPQLAWLSEQRCSGVSRFNFCRPARGGPIAEFFTEKFALIYPSSGSEDQLKGARRLADEFQAAWKKTNFVDCKTVRDNEAIEEDCNLVIVGSPATNLIWKQLEQLVPVVVEKNHAKVPGAIVVADNYGLQAWCIHPLAPGKKILFIGGWDCSRVKFGTLELCLDGWFDFSIWSQSEAGPTLSIADRYRVP
jgi:hypothetical protein